MGQTQGTALAISIAEQDVEKYLKQRQQEIGMYQGSYSFELFKFHDFLLLFP